MNIREDLFVRDNIGRTIQCMQGTLTLQIAGDEHGGGQLGIVDFALTDQTVTQIGDTVGRDNADVSGAVTGQLQNAETHAAKIERCGIGRNDDIGREALLQKILAAFSVGQRHIIGAVGIGINGDAGLDDLRRGRTAVTLL